MDSRTNPLAWLAMTIAGLLGGLLIASPAKAEGSAQFIYHVSHSVFGDIGTYTNPVEPTRDGVTVKTQAHFEVKMLGVRMHREDAERTERWQGNRLVAFRGVTDKGDGPVEVKGEAHGNRCNGFWFSGRAKPRPSGGQRAAPPRAWRTSASSHQWEAHRWLQKGLDARREWGAYPLRYVTNEQRRRRTLFQQPRGPMAIWPIFRVACSSRTDQSMLVARALKIGQIADGGMPPTYETMHLGCNL